jgi:hypothetical protein
MTDAPLLEDAERELLTLLIQADRADNIGPLNPGRNGAIDSSITKSRDFFQKVSKSLQFIATVPFLVVVLVLWFLMSVVSNVVRLVVAKVKKRPFKLEWMDSPRASIGTVGQLKIMIYTNDHPPPHFHVVTNKYNAKFHIETCELLDGAPPGRHINAIRNWHTSRIELLREKWRVTRPGDVFGSQSAPGS